MHKQTGNDRLVNLHTRLNHEAEKIAQWKVSTEIELHQKEKLLEESEQTIKALRQTLLDVQLQNENLSLKIQEEINHRDEMEQRMVTTREMYAFLKTHIETIEDRLMKCEEDRTELKYLDKERIEQFEDLSSQFTKLEITQFEKHQEILDKWKDEQALNTEQKQKYESNLLQAECELKTLMESLEGKASNIQELNGKLEKRHEELQDLQKQCYMWSERLKTSDKLLDEASNNLNTTSKELDEMKISKEETELKLTDERKCNVQFTKANQELEEQLELAEKRIEQLLAELSQTETKLEEESSRLSEVKTAYRNSQQAVEELKSIKDDLLIEKGDITKRLENTELAMVKLEKEHAQLHKKFSRIVTENETRKAQCLDLEEINNDLKQQTIKIAGDLEHAAEEEERLMTEVGNLKTQLEAEMSEKDKLAVKIQDKDKELDILGQQSNETNSTLMMNLNDKQKEMENLVSKIADLTGDYTNASTKVKGLELENGSLTMNLNGQQTRIENLESKLADLTGDYANATTKVKELEIEGEKMQRKNEGVKADIAKMELNCDVRIADMIALLDKHKLRDEKKLEIKCKEVKDMAKKLEECKQKELANTGQIKNMQLKLKEAEQKELESKGLKEKCEQLEKCAERVKQLEGDVAVRDQEMKELLQAVKNMEQRRVVEPVTPVAQTPKRVSLPPTRRKTPQTPKTPVRDQEKMTQMKTTMSTPLAGILKNRSSSITRKRSVVFSEMDGADSSASEHMEVDYKEIQARFQVMQKGSASGSVRKTGFAYTRVPSTPQAMARESTAKQQQQQKKMKVSEEESKQFDTIFFPKENNSANINIKQQEQIAVNQQKTNNKFVKNSCKDRRRDFEKKGEIKKADLAWFETQDMFGFEAED